MCYLHLISFDESQFRRFVTNHSELLYHPTLPKRRETFVKKRGDFNNAENYSSLSYYMRPKKGLKYYFQSKDGDYFLYENQKNTHKNVLTEHTSAPFPSLPLFISLKYFIIFVDEEDDILHDPEHCARGDDVCLLSKQGGEVG